MRIIGVEVAGGAPVFNRELTHGTDPHRLAWDRGYRIVRPLSVSGTAPDLSLTVQVSRHGRRVIPRNLARTRWVDPTIDLDVEPVVRQRVAAYGIVLSDRGVLATEFSAKTAVAGMWGLPGGGINPGENAAEAVSREVGEETEQELEISQLLDVQSDHWIGRAPSGVIEDFHAVRIIFAGRCQHPSEPRVRDVGGTTSAAAWVALEAWDRFPWASSAKSLLERHLGQLVSAWQQAG